MEEYFLNDINVKDIQQKMLEILIEVDRVCKKNDIKYVLDSGTLLGAVRHNGFIPWDDDIDIAMLREDYEKFRKVANRDLAPQYRFLSDVESSEFPNIFGKVFDTSTTYVQGNISHLDIPHSIWLDIFPCDNIYIETKTKQCRIVASINMVRCLKQKTEKFEPRHIFYFPLLVLPMKTLNKIAEKTMQKHSGEITDLVCPICQSGIAKPTFKRGMFTDTIEKEFEGLMFPIPREYMEYLKGYYKEPMELPPIESRHPGHGIKEIKL